MAKPTIVTRAGKGSALTWTEGDANVTNLQNATLTLKAGTGGTDVASDLNGTVTIVAGTNISLSGDNSAKTLTITNTASAGIASVSADATPSLGGNLNVAGYSIVTTSSGNITLAPNNSGNIFLTPTTGYIKLAAVKWPAGAGTANYVLQTNGTDQLSWTALPSAGIASVSADASPSLGGNLNVSTRSIVSSSNGNIAITPNGSGKVVIDGASWPKSSSSSTVDGSVTNVSGTTDTLTLSITAGFSPNDPIVFSGAGVSSLGLTSGTTYYVINIMPIAGTIQVATAPSGSAIDLTGSGSVSSVTYSVTSGGGGPSNGQVLTWGASGTLTWSTPSGGIASVSADTNPSLGGNLTVMGYSIISASNGNITLAPNGSGKSRVNALNYNEGSLYDIGTSGGTITPDVTNGNVQKITLNSALTFNAFNSPVAGQSLTLIIYGGTSYTSITSTMKFSGGIKTLTATSGCIDILSVYYDGTNYFASLGKGFA